MNKVFFLTFLEAAILILFTSIWLGLSLANRIINPLGTLIDASEKVRMGDMTARVDVDGNWGEISDLGSAFNKMTYQLSTQRDELVREHDLSEQRRQFSEAVLSGVRAGVIGLNQAGKITIMNQSAKRLLSSKDMEMAGYPISQVLPEFLPAFNKAKDSIGGHIEDQINFETKFGTRNFDLSVSAYSGSRKDTGWVMTFDDMTRLVAAQRHSAWREVARRIAHEIKNPLTPIQLSAERLLKKYSNEIVSDPDVFRNCTQTIIRQVSSLEKMVDEFSAFARMPAPNFSSIDFKVLISNIMFSQRVSFPEIKFDVLIDKEKSSKIICDERLITQALTNIYKNGGESITRRFDETGDDNSKGKISTFVKYSEEHITISIFDNGTGWPVQDKDRLLEPYVTTRENGTGLGLAIVMRIAEDHGGKLKLNYRTDNKPGAVVEISIRKNSAENYIKAII
jgi:two-component system nitrogen regulation sensor histidine kinase NtrY